jgi:hypothetical protein
MKKLINAVRDAWNDSEQAHRGRAALSRWLIRTNLPV